MADRGRLAERIELDAPAFDVALAECGERARDEHEFRVSQHKRMLESFGVPMTPDHLSALAKPYAVSARKLRNKARSGSERHRGWRLAALHSARALYTLARRAQ